MARVALKKSPPFGGRGKSYCRPKGTGSDSKRDYTPALDGLQAHAADPSTAPLRAAVARPLMGGVGHPRETPVVAHCSTGATEASTHDSRQGVGPIP